MTDDGEKSGRPPRAKGSGARGKGEKTESVSPFKVIADRRFTVKFNGKMRVVDAEIALQLRTYQDALTGKKIGPIKDVIKWIESREKTHPDRRFNLPVIKFENQSPVRVDEALVILKIAEVVAGKAVDGRPFLQLDPEFVTLALARPGGKKLSHSTLQDIAEQTARSETVCWPKDSGL